MTAKTARMERRRDQVRKEILDATRTVLLAKGLSGLTLAAVAREVQLTKAALYYYFDSKESLVFEVAFQGFEAHARAVSSAVAETTSGAEALEALVRVSADHFGSRLDELRIGYMVPQASASNAIQFDADMLARLRPLNELVYGSVAGKIRTDQDAGVVNTAIDGRRLAFVAHAAVIGVLTFEGLVDAADDSPLLHGRADMINDVVRAFVGRLAAS